MASRRILSDEVIDTALSAVNQQIAASVNGNEPQGVDAIDELAKLFNARSALTVLKTRGGRAEVKPGGTTRSRRNRATVVTDEAA